MTPHHVPKPSTAMQRTCWMPATWIKPGRFCSLTIFPERKTAMPALPLRSVTGAGEKSPDIRYCTSGTGFSLKKRKETPGFLFRNQLVTRTDRHHCLITAGMPEHPGSFARIFDGEKRGNFDDVSKMCRRCVEDVSKMYRNKGVFFDTSSAYLRRVFDTSALFPASFCLKKPLKKCKIRRSGY